MATVSCYLLVISAGLVQDVYLRFINPQATSKQLRLMTNISMIGVGVAAILSVINPPDYLQAMVVMSTSIGASALAIPMLMACYWRRATSAGTMTAMLAGSGVVLLLFGVGQVQAALVANESGGWVGALVGTDSVTQLRSWLGPAQTIGMAKGFKPIFIMGFEPVVWGLLTSAICGVGVSLVTKPPREEHLVQFFDAPMAK
jgi:Na+/proline symporter